MFYEVRSHRIDVLHICLHVSFLRSVAYREFTRLVYGPLGRKRIPLPAGAYTQIRTVFPGSSEETHAGFEMPEI